MINRKGHFQEPKNLNELLNLVAANPAAVEEVLMHSPSISNRIFSERLFRWLSANSSIESAKHTAGVIQYNDSPLFGAKKRKAQLVSHILILNTALVIHATNKICSQDKVKTIVDEFISLSLKNCFHPVGAINKSLSKNYEEGLSFYFDRLKSNRSPLGLAQYFCQKLKIKKNVDVAETYVAATINSKINELTGLLLLWSSTYSYLKPTNEGRIIPGSNFAIIVHRYKVENQYPDGSLGLARDLKSKGAINNDLLYWESKSVNFINDVVGQLSDAGLNCNNDDYDCAYFVTESGKPLSGEREWLSCNMISTERCEVWLS